MIHTIIDLKANKVNNVVYVWSSVTTLTHLPAIELLTSILEGGYHVIDNVLEEHFANFIVQSRLKLEFNLEGDPCGVAISAWMELPIGLQEFKEIGLIGDGGDSCRSLNRYERDVLLMEERVADRELGFKMVLLSFQYSRVNAPRDKVLIIVDIRNYLK